MAAASRRMGPKTRFFFARVFPWPFVAVGGVLLFIGVRGLLRGRASTDWPAVEGTITSSAVRRQQGGGRHSSSTYHAQVVYEYTVDGVAYNGDRVGYGDYGSSSPSHARGIVNRYPKGKAVTVHYMPGDPEECVLEPGLHGQGWLLPGIGLAFFAAGTMAAIGLPKLMKALERPGAARRAAETRRARPSPSDNPYRAD